jgi:hypothetical protein
VQTPREALPWSDYADTPPQGTFFVRKPAVLAAIRLRMLRDNRCPRVLWRWYRSPACFDI